MRLTAIRPNLSANTPSWPITLTPSVYGSPSVFAASEALSRFSGRDTGHTSWTKPFNVFARLSGTSR